ncbi:hypothetical protein C0099_11205 [Pseudazoarcus pumilus]|uniref:Uncharacterized protein n=2 Tax=Pseudazoarcus pumilus TaxID=2067960 RepID=A0A2I6SB24_9RHOO|nr:hypothetical protein C0099_11205 [Pseudazoarcus pumilus]
MAEEARARGRSTFRGHPIVWIGDRWIYSDNKQPIPGYGGTMRPCIVCGSEKWSGDGDVDECLGLLPGVTNACCGHGDRDTSYVVFESGVVLRGFFVARTAGDD